MQPGEHWDCVTRPGTPEEATMVFTTGPRCSRLRVEGQTSGGVEICKRQIDAETKVSVIESGYHCKSSRFSTPSSCWLRESSWFVI